MEPDEKKPPESDRPNEIKGTDSKGPPIFATIDALIDADLDQYHIEKEIGRGSMGVVFEALDKKKGRKVALKVLPPNISLSDKIIRRFLREAESVAKLDHPNIVKIYDIGHRDSIYYYAMELIEGTPLDDILAEGMLLPFNKAARLVIQACEAVHFAHLHQIIHRDIKPGNIIITREEKVVITDFGLARQEKAATLTESGALVGTPIYMSPEQVIAKRGGVDKRTDIYSLGVTLYQLLTGIPPFSGDSTQKILNQILEEEPKPPHRCRIHVPRSLSIIAVKALEKDPNHRFQTAGEMAEELRRYLDGLSIRFKPAGIITRIGKRIRRHKIISVLAALTALLSMTFLGYFIFSTQTINESRTLIEEKSREQKYFENVALAKDMFAQTATGANLDSIVDLLDEAIQSFPKRVDAHILLGKVLALQSKLRRALEELNTAVAVDSQSSDAYLARGLFLLDQGRQLNRENAVALGFSDLKNAIALDPGNPVTAYSIAKTLYDCSEAVDLGSEERMGMIGHAFQYAQTAQAFGTTADVECLLAQIHLEFARNATSRLEKTTHLESAHGFLEKALELDNNHSLAFQLKQEVGKMLEEPGIDTEEVDARHLIQQQGLGSFFTHAARIYGMVKSDIAQTISEAEENNILDSLMILLSPDPAVSLATQTLEAAAAEEENLDYAGLMEKASIYMDRGDFASAIRCYSRALVLSPAGAHQVNYKIALAHLSEDKLELALQHARLAYSQEPKNISYVQLLGRILKELKDYEGFKKLYDEAKRNGTQTALEFEMPPLGAEGEEENLP